MQRMVDASQRSRAQREALTIALASPPVQRTVTTVVYNKPARRTGATKTIIASRQALLDAFDRYDGSNPGVLGPWADVRAYLTQEATAAKLDSFIQHGTDHTLEFDVDAEEDDGNPWVSCLTAIKGYTEYSADWRTREPTPVVKVADPVEEKKTESLTVPLLPSGWQGNGPAGLKILAQSIVDYVLGADGTTGHVDALTRGLLAALPTDWENTASTSKLDDGQSRHGGTGGSAYRLSDPAVRNKAAVYAAAHGWTKVQQPKGVGVERKKELLARYKTLKAIKDKKQEHNLTS